MTNEIQIFKFNDHLVRIVEKDGEPWWVAKDVCAYFGDTNYRRSITNLAEDEKGVSQIDTPGGIQSMTVISEAGLYALLFAMQPEKSRSVTEEYIAERQQKIKAFRRWATHEVFPAIRKTGSYSMTPQLPQNYLEALEALVEKEKERIALSTKIEEDKPKVDFYNAVGATDNDIIVRDMAKLLCQNGYDIGEKRLFAQLREKGYLIKAKPDWNRPTQRAMELGLFRVQEKVLYNEIGNPSRTVFTTKVTPKGQQYFLKAFQDGTF